MTSEEAAKQFPDESIDFVFIDGDHSYEGCAKDIDLWYPKLKEGGLLSGHDYRDGRNYGVKQAVHEFAAREGTQFRTGENYTWFVTR
jgi:predicted O-methyltransferase YrrM